MGPPRDLSRRTLRVCRLWWLSRRVHGSTPIGLPSGPVGRLRLLGVSPGVRRRVLPLRVLCGRRLPRNQCDCAFYELYCNRLEGEECTPFLQEADPSEPDKKPFFGCDKRELDGICDEAKSCKAKGDLQGLPQLGTWQGSVTTGIKKSSGEKMGASFVAVVTLFSAIWHMV